MLFSFIRATMLDTTYSHATNASLAWTFRTADLVFLHETEHHQFNTYISAIFLVQSSFQSFVYLRPRFALGSTDCKAVTIMPPNLGPRRTMISTGLFPSSELSLLGKKHPSVFQARLFSTLSIYLFCYEDTECELMFFSQR